MTHFYYSREKYREGERQREKQLLKLNVGYYYCSVINVGI